jgi:hypothetical protein
MTICVSCGEYFRTNAWHNDSNTCQNCYCTLPIVIQDDDYEVERNHLLNPSGKTPAVFYDDREGYLDGSDSHGY